MESGAVHNNHDGMVTQIYCKYCDFLIEYTVVFLKVWGKVYIFLKCPECILPEGPKALKEIYFLRGLKENIDPFAPNLKKDTVYS